MDGDTDRYDAEVALDPTIRAIGELQDAGIESDVWKIEGVDERADCERIAAKCRDGGRDGVVCVVLGRGADNDKVDHWLRQGAPVDGYVGFAIGRSIWGDPLKDWIDGNSSREDAAVQIADNYLRFVEGVRRRCIPVPLATRCGFLPEQLDIGNHAGDDRQPEGEQAIGEHRDDRQSGVDVKPDQCADHPAIDRAISCWARARCSANIPTK